MRRVETLVIVSSLVIGGFMGLAIMTGKNASALVWSFGIVDDSGSVGYYTSIALDVSGFPHISYRGDGDLRYAKWTGNRWNTETVDTVGGDHTSIALDSSGYPHISYHASDLKYARWTGVAWSIEIVDSIGLGGEYTSIALDSSGYPHISYHTNNDLKYAKWTGSAWSIETVDSAGDVGIYTSIALDASGYPHISYADGTNVDLKYAKWTGSAWSIETVDSAGSVGGGSSLGLDSSGYPHMSYWDGSSGDLKYAKWTGSAWSIETVDSLGNVGPESSIALDAGGNPHISYYDATNSDLKYARWTGSAWNIETANSGHRVGGYTSIALDSSGYPHISYFDLSNAYLKYARRYVTMPQAPQILQATADDAQVTLSWDAPLSDGGSPITNYRIHRGSFSGGEIFLVEIGNVLTYADMGVTNGQTYYYKVSAKSALGEGALSAEVSATPATVPTAPTGLIAISGESYANLTWNLPTFEGGSPITNYRIHRGISSGSETFLVEIGDLLHYNDTGVTNGVTYYYQVSAKNVAGEGTLSNEVSATPRGPPSPPQNLQASAGDSYVNISWNSPVSDGGSPITHYRIYRGTTSGSETFLVEIGDLLHYNDTSVTSGVTYYYRVSGVNSLGEGGLSDEASATSIGSPSPPQNLQASAGDSYVNISWNSPASDGGSPITHYRVFRGTVSGEEILLVELGNVLTHTDTGLTNGQTYYYQVRAVNVIGEGPSSNEVVATPATFPAAPDGLATTPGDSRVNITWSPPASDGGSPITQYRIYRGTTSGGETFFVGIGDVLYYSDMTVTNGITYYYRVRSVNSVGESPLSDEASATPINQPPTCTILNPSIGVTISGTVGISGTASDSDGTLQRVETRIDDDNWIQVSGTTSWSHSWDTTTVSNGQHTIYARSYDGTNYSSEASVRITVDNPEESMSENLWFWASIAMLMIIVLLLVLLILSKRKGEETTPVITRPEETESQKERPRR